MAEIWKPVPDCPNYFVSNLGRVRGPRSFIKPIWGGQKGNEYLYVGMYQGKRKVNRLLNGLVCTVFNGDRPKGAHAAHKNGDKSDNSANNLHWLSAKENIADKKVHGTEHMGEDRWCSKLTDEDVRVIRRECVPGRPRSTTRLLAEKFNVSVGTIYAVIHGKTWVHVS